MKKNRSTALTFIKPKKKMEKLLFTNNVKCELKCLMKHKKIKIYRIRMAQWQIPQINYNTSRETSAYYKKKKRIKM